MPPTYTFHGMSCVPPTYTFHGMRCVCPHVHLSWHEVYVPPTYIFHGMRCVSPCREKVKEQIARDKADKLAKEKAEAEQTKAAGAAVASPPVNKDYTTTRLQVCVCVCILANITSHTHLSLRFVCLMGRLWCTLFRSQTLCKT